MLSALPVATAAAPMTPSPASAVSPTAENAFLALLTGTPVTGMSTGEGGAQKGMPQPKEPPNQQPSSVAVLGATLPQLLEAAGGKQSHAVVSVKAAEVAAMASEVPSTHLTPAGAVRGHDFPSEEQASELQHPEALLPLLTVPLGITQAATSPTITAAVSPVVQQQARAATNVVQGTQEGGPDAQAAAAEQFGLPSETVARRNAAPGEPMPSLSQPQLEKEAATALVKPGATSPEPQNVSKEPAPAAPPQPLQSSTSASSTAGPSTAPSAVLPQSASAPPNVSNPTPVPEPTIAFASPRFAEDVGIAIARRIAPASEASELTLRIEPADLGRIQVQLRFDANGSVEAVLSADQPRVLEQLKLGGGDLYRALIETAGRGDVAPIRFESRSDLMQQQNASGGGSLAGNQGQGGQQGSGQGGGQQHGRAASSLPAAPWSAESAATIPLSIMADRVDLLA